MAARSVILSLATFAAVPTVLSPALAQVDAAGKPPATAAKEVRVALAYETAEDPQELPVRSVGFYLSLGRRFELKPIEGSHVCEADLAYAGHAFRFRVEECHSVKPEVRLDRAGNTDWERVERLPQDRFLHRQKSYLQAMLPPLNAKLAARALRLICVTNEGRTPYAYLGDRGVWSGALPVGSEPLRVCVYDGNADGDLSNDDLLLDVDGDGRITRVERIRNGETILLGEHAITLRITGAPNQVIATVARRRDGQGRDLREELRRAPIVGNVIPEFEFTDQHGRLVSSRALRGKVLLVNFWGVW